MQQVKERHGVVLSEEDKAHATIYERKSGGIGIIMGKGVSSISAVITPDEADYLASRLRRLAKKQRGFQA